MERKIKDLDELAELIGRLRQTKRIVHCHGVFDLLHIGHIRYLRQARTLGDVVVVTITPDRYVDKGPNRPAFGEALRAEALASLDVVDYVAVNKWPTAEEVLRLLRPHVYVKGSEFKDLASDFTGKIAREAQVVDEIGAELFFAEDIVFSSTNLINRFFSSHPEEVRQYLAVFRQRHSIEACMDLLEKMSSLKVLVVGDTILDDYHYCQAIGKSSKDPILALKYESSDLFAGGVLAVANHLANFARDITVVSVLGEKDPNEGFIRLSLPQNVEPHFVQKPSAPTIIKRRFIDGYSMNKLFEVYIMDDSLLPEHLDKELREWLVPRLDEYDAVILCDYGHGAISPSLRETLMARAKFVGVNTQANAGNRGFNCVSKYERPHYACIAEHELRLEMRTANDPVRNMMGLLNERLKCPLLVVTCGRDGCALLTDDGTFLKVPSVAERVVDRVGAGDAFFALTALAATLRAPAEITAFLGNVCGAIGVETIGNKKAVNKQAIQKYIRWLLK